MSDNVSIGIVKLASGISVKVSVDQRTGEVYPVFIAKDGRTTTWAGMQPVECDRVNQLLAHAAKVAPSIKAAHDTLKRANETAQATYHRIVRNAVGAR